ncbi:hypothetical protein J6590_068096 [Homalodisca vitripennis]|nr:hypothetical protein J6590_068096 [Homalodisca vitripennis]
MREYSVNLIKPVGNSQTVESDNTRSGSPTAQLPVRPTNKISKPTLLSMDVSLNSQQDLIRNVSKWKRPFTSSGVTARRQLLRRNDFLFIADTGAMSLPPTIVPTPCGGSVEPGIPGESGFPSLQPLDKTNYPASRFNVQMRSFQRITSLERLSCNFLYRPFSKGCRSLQSSSVSRSQRCFSRADHLALVTTSSCGDSSYRN